MSRRTAQEFDKYGYPIPAAPIRTHRASRSVSTPTLDPGKAHQLDHDRGSGRQSDSHRSRREDPVPDSRSRYTYQDRPPYGYEQGDETASGSLGFDTQKSHARPRASTRSGVDIVREADGAHRPRLPSAIRESKKERLPGSRQTSVTSAPPSFPPHTGTSTGVRHGVETPDRRKGEKVESARSARMDVGQTDRLPRADVKETELSPRVRTRYPPVFEPLPRSQLQHHPGGSPRTSRYPPSLDPRSGEAWKGTTSSTLAPSIHMGGTYQTRLDRGANVRDERVRKDVSRGDETGAYARSSRAPQIARGDTPLSPSSGGEYRPLSSSRRLGDVQTHRTGHLVLPNESPSRQSNCKVDGDGQSIGYEMDAPLQHKREGNVHGHVQVDRGRETLHRTDSDTSNRVPMKRDESEPGYGAKAERPPPIPRKPGRRLVDPAYAAPQSPTPPLPTAEETPHQPTVASCRDPVAESAVPANAPHEAPPVRTASAPAVVQATGSSGAAVDRSKLDDMEDEITCPM